MGSWFSSSKEATPATNNGQANNANSITISENLNANSDVQLYLIVALVILQIAKFILHIYSLHSKMMKKKYQGRAVAVVPAVGPQIA